MTKYKYFILLLNFIFSFIFFYFNLIFKFEFEFILILVGLNLTVTEDILIHFCIGLIICVVTNTFENEEYEIKSLLHSFSLVSVKKNIKCSICTYLQLFVLICSLFTQSTIIYSDHSYYQNHYYYNCYQSHHLAPELKFQQQHISPSNG